MQRRFFIKAGLLLIASTQAISNGINKVLETTGSNFKYIYSNNYLKSQFYKFLENVFHLYPEKEFHSLIDDVTASLPNDEEIYQGGQAKIGDISSFTNVFKYQLPALLKQKNEMARQTVELLGKDTKYNGYLEIGSSGRYLDYLEEKVSIEGKRYYADGKEPGYAITEMIDRGQICIGAE